MDEKKLDLLIEQSIIEARTLWLDTLPHKGELSRHAFSPRFRMRIRRMAGMRYTLLYFLKLMGLGVIAILLGYLPIYLAIIPMAPMLFVSFTRHFVAILGAVSSVFVAPIAVYFLQHLWRWLGEWSRSREMGSHRVTVATAMSLPALTAVAYALAGHMQLPAWVAESTLYQMFEGGIGPFRVLAGYSIFKDLFWSGGALLWLLVYTAVFYAGNRGISFRPLLRPLYLMALAAGLYEGAVVLQLPHLLPWFKAGYLLGLIWMLCGLADLMELKKPAQAIWRAAALVLAVALMFADLTDADEIAPRVMPLFAQGVEDIFPGYGTAPIEMRCGGRAVVLDEVQQAEVWRLLATIDLGALRETDSEEIGQWSSAMRITLVIRDPEKPCIITLAKVPPRIDGAGNRIYRLGLSFENGEEYVYTGDDPAQLPLDLLWDLGQ